MSSSINYTVTLSLFSQKCYFTAWFGTDLFVVVERSKDNTRETSPKFSGENFGHVYLLFTCKIRDSCHLHAA